jgi:hypothetical protein
MKMFPKILVTLIAVGCALPSAMASVPAPDAANEQAIRDELTQLEADMCIAAETGDVPMHSALLAPTLTDVSATGHFMRSRDENDEFMKASEVDVCSIEDLDIRIYGDTAIVVGLVQVEMSGFSGHIRYTDTFLHRDGKWLIYASQSTIVQGE